MLRWNVGEVDSLTHRPEHHSSLKIKYAKSQYFNLSENAAMMRLDFKRIFISLCLRSFEALKTRKKCCVHYFSPDRPKIRKGLVVDLS